MSKQVGPFLLLPWHVGRNRAWFESQRDHFLAPWRGFQERVAHSLNLSFLNCQAPSQFTCSFMSTCIRASSLWSIHAKTAFPPFLS